LLVFADIVVGPPSENYKYSLPQRCPPPRNVNIARAICLEGVSFDKCNNQRDSMFKSGKCDALGCL
jgi:hypothetical protein